ncbi:MAG: hypothetical protein Q7S66_00385 [bacterium]|nr:hypothetical protein [bacterium]
MPATNNFNRRARKQLRWRVIYVTLICLIGSSSIFFAYFIYYNVFSTLSNSSAAGVLQAVAYIDTIDSVAYDKARLIVNKKNQTALSIKLESLRNPFIKANPHATSTKPIIN